MTNHIHDHIAGRHTILVDVAHHFRWMWVLYELFGIIHFFTMKLQGVANHGKNIPIIAIFFHPRVFWVVVGGARRPFTIIPLFSPPPRKKSQ